MLVVTPRCVWDYASTHLPHASRRSQSPRSGYVENMPSTASIYGISFRECSTVRWTFRVAQNRSFPGPFLARSSRGSSRCHFSGLDPQQQPRSHNLYVSHTSVSGWRTITSGHSTELGYLSKRWTTFVSSFSKLALLAIIYQALNVSFQTPLAECSSAQAPKTCSRVPTPRRHMVPLAVVLSKHPATTIIVYVLALQPTNPSSALQTPHSSPIPTELAEIALRRPTGIWWCCPRRTVG